MVYKPDRVTRLRLEVISLRLARAVGKKLAPGKVVDWMAGHVLAGMDDQKPVISTDSVLEHRFASRPLGRPKTLDRHLKHMSALERQNGLLFLTERERLQIEIELMEQCVDLTEKLRMDGGGPTSLLNV